MISERQETNKVSPMIPSAYCLESISRQQYREKEPRQGQVNEDMELGIGKTRAARICKTRYQRRENYTKRTFGDLQSPTPPIRQLNSVQHMYMRLGKEPPERVRRNNPQILLLHTTINSACSFQPEWKNLIIQSIRILKSVLPQ